RLGESLPVEGDRRGPGDAADSAGGQPARIEVEFRALSARRRAEARGFDRLEQPVAAERVEGRPGDVYHVDVRFGAADHLFDLGQSAVINLGRDPRAGFLGERFEISDLLRLPVGASPCGDAERILRPRAGADDDADGETSGEAAKSPHAGESM